MSERSFIKTSIPGMKMACGVHLYPTSKNIPTKTLDNTHSFVYIDLLQF